MLAIFLTVFLDLLSFGLFIPDLQLRGVELAGRLLGSSDHPRIGFYVGASLGVFSLAQLLTAPLLGRLSDRVGRRRILILTTVLSIGSYLVYSQAETFWIVIVARVLSGIAAANLGVAFAYMADVTEPKERAKGMGLIGAAFGMGFILGPVAGALLLKAGNNHPALLGYAGAALGVLNLVYVVAVLPESRPVTQAQTGRFFGDLGRAFRTPTLALMLVMFFALNLGFTNLETTFFQLLAEKRWIHGLGPDARQTGAYILGIVGVVSAVMQGLIVRIATPRFGEVRLLRFAYLGLVPALALTPFLPLWAPMVLGVVFLGICTGLAQPSLSSLISRSAPRELQGGVFGITQGLGAVARFLGPLISNPLFHWKPYAPYLLGAGIALIPACAVWWLRMPDDEPEGA